MYIYTRKFFYLLSSSIVLLLILFLSFGEARSSDALRALLFPAISINGSSSEDSMSVAGVKGLPPIQSNLILNGQFQMENIKQELLMMPNKNMLKIVIKLRI